METPNPTEQQPGAIREVLGMTATARAFCITPQALHGRLKRGSCPLQPVARAGKRLLFDAEAVARASAIVTANTAQP